MINQAETWGGGVGAAGSVQPASAKHLPGVRLGGGALRPLWALVLAAPGDGRRSLLEAIKLNFQATALDTLSWGAPLPMNSPQVAQRESASVKMTWTFKSLVVEEALSFLPETWGWYVGLCSPTAHGLLEPPPPLIFVER